MKKKELILYIILFIVWFILVLTTGMHHEPWADEAQSWLIARDNTTFDIITKVLKYEGHPALWYLVLRFLYLLKVPYSAIYLVPLLFSAGGVYLFMFKTKLPVIIKCLFPFTYFIAYQYSVIARSYCILFPLLTIIAVFYKYRLKNPLVYSFLLILLMSSETYNFVIAFVLLVFFAYDIFKSKQYNRKTIGAFLLTITFCVLTVLYMLPPSDCVTNETFVLSVVRMSRLLVHGYFSVRENLAVHINELVIVLIFYLSAITVFCKKRSDVLFFLAVNGSILLVISGLVCHFWHNGYIFLTFIFTITVLCEENDISTSHKYIKKLFYIILVFFSAIQISWTVFAAITDYFEPYTEAKEIAKVIKTANLDRYDIGAVGYNTVAMQPYFQHNIYNNFKHSYFEWDKESEKYNIEMAKKYPPVIIVDNMPDDKYYDLIASIDVKNYNIYTFNKVRYLNGILVKVPEFSLYVSKGILSSLK